MSEPTPSSHGILVRSMCCLALTVSVATLCVPDESAPIQGAAPEKLQLNDVLLRLGRVARLYRDSALSFSCEEKISDTGLGHRTYHFQYTYVYDKSKGFLDYRTRPGSDRELDLNSYRIPRILRKAYSWAFIFEESRHKLYRYEILGEERIADTDALKVRFDPIAPYRRELNEWFGTAWIDRKSFQLLRVEAMRADEYSKWREFQEALEKAGRSGETKKKHYLVERISTDFTVQRNGMRFPGQVDIQMYAYTIPRNAVAEVHEESIVYHVQQVYSNYRFFNVRTKEEIRDLVSGRTVPLED